jgi:hypothetical protein
LGNSQTKIHHIPSRYVGAGATGRPSEAFALRLARPQPFLDADAGRDVE